MTVDSLAALLHPPESPRHDVTWPDVQSELGVSFSDDYRAVIDAYGGGAIGSYIEVLNPRTPSDFAAVTGVAKMAMDRDISAEIGGGPPLPSYPGSGERLLPVIHHADGQFLCAVIIDDQHDDSTYWFIDLKMKEYVPMAGPLSELLLGLFPDRDGWRQATVNWRIDDPVFTPRN